MVKLQQFFAAIAMLANIAHAHRHGKLLARAQLHGSCYAVKCTRVQWQWESTGIHSPYVCSNLMALEDEVYLCIW